MKNVIKVSIGRWAFTLNEEAYALLENFLDQLKAYYEKETDADQRVQDIESRIGEYLSDCIKSIDQVVDEKQIQQAIESLNLPDFGEQAASAGKTESGESSNYTRSSKRLYRSAERKVLGGVFSGMGEYFGIDPVGLRLLYVIFVVIGMISFRWNIDDHVHFRLFGMGGFASFLFIMYFIMWIVVPMARTPQEKRAMKGGRSSARRVVHDMGNQSETNYRESGNSSLGSFLLSFFRVFVSIVLILIGATGLLVLPMLLYFWDIPADWFGYLGLLPLHPGLIWFKVLTLIAVFVPLLLFLYEGIVLLFKLRVRKLNLGVIFLAIWILSLFVLAFSSLLASRAFWGEGKFQNTEVLELPSDTIYLEMEADFSSPEQFICTCEDDFFIYCNKSSSENKFLYVFPRIRLSTGDTPEMTQKVNLRAKNNFIAQMKAEDAIDFVKLEGNRIKVKPLYFDKDQPWSFEQMSLHLSLPHDCILYVQGKKGKWQELKHNRGSFYPFVGYTNEHNGFIIKNSF
ncbi:MAG: PspC domain-containing protein [Bacteroidales bacterium]|nr:PspC domain-containing protein [Bacteroidales bacterium]MDD3430557.1 PspC domain-containing protein [Bacteroidales bacterium]MDD4361101.1 PspC domain-containing protein [Bacteroidales bacterium]MDD4429940.1 PspC domain-containing protein [Bacteroidales bacterium]